MAEVISFLLRSPSDEAFVRAAREQGLLVRTDAWGYFYLQFADPPKDRSLNPHFVLAYVSKDAVADYLRARRSHHRELSAAEVYGPITRGEVGPGGPAHKAP